MRFKVQSTNPYAKRSRASLRRLLGGNVFTRVIISVYVVIVDCNLSTSPNDFLRASPCWIRDSIGTAGEGQMAAVYFDQT